MPDNLSTNLVIDVGNTRVKAAIFTGDDLVQRVTWEKCSKENIAAAVANHRVENVILSVVGSPVDDETGKWLAANFRLLNLTADTPLPFRNRYATPTTLGKDRLAGVAGAYARFPGQNCLVIDAGTCITYDVLTAAGDFLGGNISPGIGLRFNALPVFTAGLPLVQPGPMDGIVGNSTESAIRNGVQLGALLEMEGLIEMIRGEWEELNVLLTGGDANFFAEKLKTLIFANPDLVLEGLNKILNYNVQNL